MKKIRRDSDIDVGFFRALAGTTDRTVNGTATAKGTSDAAVVKVTIPSTATSVRASFDPVSLEQDQAIRTLNQSLRGGYVRPKSSTR